MKKSGNKLSPQQLIELQFKRERGRGADFFLHKEMKNNKEVKKETDC